MKKEYEKPTIEGEEFVANEYVAACYVISNYNGKKVVLNPTWDAWDGDRDDCGRTIVADALDTYAYYGKINGHGPTGLLKDVNGRSYQVVSVSSGANGAAGKAGDTAHPNASN